ncbi:hypothetical protein DFP72DRAFT_1065220 [Ephemerocybe angulata]|uniref:Uncharacterized protein n=1 Tax=Ephemerocybe angulata TaxID=980116 RepID=A0A8H6I5Y0_9AGAR|nr:hypothetical protein DFP72DRAFT_1065220 [Tulosesus angulatus]
MPGEILDGGRQVFTNLELTGIVFQYLKDETLKEADTIQSGMPMSLPTSWKQFFARLACLNRAFFHASIDVLWENMHSLEPFFGVLLPADRNPDSSLFKPLLYYPGVTSAQWDRFKFYSTRTKSLALHRSTSPGLSSAWALFLSTDKGKPDPLFPALKDLYLTSDDALSLLVAFSVVPQLKLLSIDLDDESDEDSGAAITTALRARASRLSRLSLLHPVDKYTASRSFSIASLTSLCLALRGTTTEVPWAKMHRLHRLERFELKQSLNDDESSEVPSLADIAQHLSRPSPFPGMRELAVEASSSMQYQVAASVSPHSLKRLHIKVLANNPYEQMLVLPHVLTVHMKRNPNLTTLTAECPHRGEINPDAISHLRGDLRFNKIEPLISGLSALRNLTTLKISGLPFLAVDIMIRLLDAVRSLSQLEVLWLNPKSMTHLEADGLLVPPLHSLQGISRNNQRLVQCFLLVQYSAIPDLPVDYVSTNRLKHLDLYHPAYFEDLEDIATTDQKLRIARYLDRLFPYLKTIMNHVPQGSGAWEMWSEVEKILLSFQDLRAQAIRDFATLPNALAVEG